MLSNWIKSGLRATLVAATIGAGMHAAPARAQAPGTTPITVSHETMMLHGRKYYVHIVEKGQTVYSISKAYKVESYDAVTHVDIHFLHPGDTVWLPARGQFSEAAEQESQRQQAESKATNLPSTQREAETTPKTTESQPTRQAERKPAAEQKSTTAATAPTAKPVGKTLKIGLMMPLHLDQMDEVSTSKFDIEQRGKKSYRQFEFIEFYEGMQLALERLAEEGVSVRLNVADVSDNDPTKVEAAFRSKEMGESDVVIALLLRESFDKAAELAREAGVYIVNPMATRTELCTENPYVVKMQPSTAGLVSTMLRNIKAERPDGHLYIIHSNVKAERAVMEELKKQLGERGDIEYTLFNWSQNAKLTQVMKKTPGCSVISIYDQGRDPNRVYAGNLLNKLAAFKQATPVLYTMQDWTREYGDIDFSQLQQVSYHCYSTAWDMGNETHVRFLKDYRTRYGSEPTTALAAMGYDIATYIAEGLHRKGASFWLAPGTGNSSELTQPIKLGRNGAGLENEKARLYHIENLKLTPARNN